MWGFLSIGLRSIIADTPPGGNRVSWGNHSQEDQPVNAAGLQIGQRGQALYDQTIKAQVEEGNRGKFLILDVNTGDYEIDAEDLTASERLLARRPDGVPFGVRIGHPAAYRMVGIKQSLFSRLN